MAEPALRASSPALPLRRTSAKISLIGLKLAFATAILVWLITSGQLELSRIWAVHSGPALAALIACKLLANALPLVRWYVMTRGLGLDLSLLSAIHIGLIGNFVSTATPGMLGQDAARLLYGRHLKLGSSAKLLSTVLADRIIGIVTLAGLGVALAAGYAGATGIIPLNHVLLLVALLALLILVAAAVFARLNFRSLRGPIGRPIQSLATALGEYRRRPRAVGLACVLSVAAHLAAFASLYFGFVSLGAEPPFWQVFALSPLLVVVRGIPTTPLGLGVVDWFGEVLYAGIDLSDGAEVVMLTRVVTLAIHAACGIPFLIPMRKRGADAAQ